ncbi:magnesium transporter [Teredinibacter turnerae]|uniref:Magnesium transporter MgtE n=1 Tax=Teredinibacter turnerae (strain ATCC 39867 / T7901) TaxID=377629 RepID=C5BSX8_TERTT|nr:magnesium transporter [Teredinibacter turnerae]ACR12718.1 magnesium transporter [Teredinibacter turnerae T7901]
MPQAAENIEHSTHQQVGRVQVLLESGTFRQVRQMLSSLRPVEIARLIASSPPPSRTVLWDLIDKDVSGEVLEELPYDIQSHFVRNMGTEELVELTEGLETDDVVDILQQLPEQVIQEVMEAMTDQDRARVEEVIAYDEATAGGLTNTDTITVRPRFTLDVVLRYLRRHPELPPSTDSLIVVNRKDDYLGLLPLSTLLTTDPSVTVREVMVTDTNAIPAAMADKDVAKLFEQHDWISAPVVNEQGKLLGRITIDDVVDVIREEADHSLMSMAGLDEDEDTFATAARTIPRRAIWLGINLITAILASSVISLFDETIDKVVALAVLMPIVASMGGVAGSQTLTVVIRGMALGQIGASNLGWLLSREVRVGIVNGILWALVMGAIAALWFQDIKIAYIIGAAMVINQITAALAGALLPVGLKALKVDPALAGGVTLTTVTDVVGFFAFLGLATYFYG